ncbi:MAG TPA: hypothetical protein VN696_05815 [Pyrinomonadaceae bacterium]|nr:hypothetical protein [Pyrinomonadaceae bacterium]
MSKKSSTRAGRYKPFAADSRPVLTAVLFCILGISGIAVDRTSAQRPATGSESASAAARNAALVAATNEVLEETSQLRELPILRPVQSSAQSRAEIERMIVGNLDRDTTAADMHASEVTLKRLGLAPANFSLRPLIVRLLTEQVAGYYDPREQEFHLADWIDADGQKPIMAHELTHALQDQHFNLRRFEKWPKGDSDAELATHALIEGDATLAMTLYVGRNPLRALTFLRSFMAADTSSQELDKAPRALRETLLFPYQEGLTWTRALYQNGGWASVSRAFKTLPQSTEQILHPPKYFIHEAPVKVLLSDLRPLLGAGWRRLDADVNGEWSLYLVLDEFLKSPSVSKQAAAGWAGDRYATYENAHGDSLYVSLSAWDTEKDAREFFDAYVKRSKLRYADARVTSERPTAWSAQTSEGGVTVELRGNRVLILEGIPAAANRRALMLSAWGR